MLAGAQGQGQAGGTRCLSGEGAPAHSQPQIAHCFRITNQGEKGLGDPGTQPGPSRSGQFRGLSFLCLVGLADESGGWCGRPGFSESPRGLVTMQTAVLTPRISDTVNPGWPGNLHF